MAVVKVFVMDFSLFPKGDYEAVKPKISLTERRYIGPSYFSG